MLEAAAIGLFVGLGIGLFSGRWIARSDHADEYERYLYSFRHLAAYVERRERQGGPPLYEPVPGPVTP